jgi:phosphoglycolate phosphatase
MRWDALIFDLDGTLWDTNATCAQAWNQVTARLAIEYRAITEADVRGVAGQPHLQAVRSVFEGLSETDVQRISDETAREDNAAIARSGGCLFAGVCELLPQLARLLPLMIVSNCQSGYIEIFLEQSGLGPVFLDFECWGRTGNGKTENLGAVVRRNRIQRPLFVGDTEGDQRAALDNGIPFVHARYGFGEVTAADYYIDRFMDLALLLR